ncbi:Peroxidase N [Rhodococcus sp. AW25M09]|nr:Peroxidase N [Rhodococcus sp. AW25M09]
MIGFDMAENIPAAVSVAQPDVVPVADRDTCPAESGRPGWALLGLLLAVSAAIAIMALGISAG